MSWPPVFSPLPCSLRFFFFPFFSFRSCGPTAVERRSKSFHLFWKENKKFEKMLSRKSWSRRENGGLVQYWFTSGHSGKNDRERNCVYIGPQSFSPSIVDPLAIVCVCVCLFTCVRNVFLSFVGDFAIGTCSSRKNERHWHKTVWTDDFSFECQGDLW